MCNLLPEVETCCSLCSLRVGMLFISVLAIMTGSVALSAIEKNSVMASYDAELNTTMVKKLMSQWVYTMIRTNQERRESLPKYTFAIVSLLCYMSIGCILMGVILLISTLAGEEGIVQVFVVGSIVLVILGFLIAIAASFECLMKYDDTYDACLVKNYDWLTGSAVMLFSFGYLCVWVYFISVANSYAMNGDS